MQIQQPSLLKTMLFFSPSLAALIGLNEAIFIQELQPRIQFRSHMYDERRWVRSTIHAWCKVFPFWSQQVIEETIQSLHNMEIIEITDEYNQDPSDERVWYAINYDAPKLQAERLQQ